MNEISIDVSNPVVYENGGHFVAAQTWKHANRVIDNVEIIVGVYGTAYIRVGQKDFELKQGSVLIIPPMARHFGYKESEKCTSFYWAHFKKTDEVIFNNEKEMPENIAFPVYFDLPNPQRIFMLFKQLLHIGESLNYNKLSKNYMLTSILIETSIQDKPATQLYDSSASKIPKIKEWIRVHMDERIFSIKNRF